MWSFLGFGVGLGGISSSADDTVLNDITRKVSVYDSQFGMYNNTVRR